MAKLADRHAEFLWRSVPCSHPSQWFSANGEHERRRTHFTWCRPKTCSMVRSSPRKHHWGSNILRADLMTATNWQTLPRFPLMDFSSLQPLSSYLPFNVQKPVLQSNDCLIRTAVQTGNAALLHILQDSHELAHFLDNVQLKDISLINLASYPDRVYTVEHQILHLLSQNEFQPSPSELPSTACIIKPMLHALLLHIYTSLRLSPVAPKIRGTLVARLYGCLNAASLVALNQ